MKSFSTQIQAPIVLQAGISSQGDFHNPHYCLSHPRAANICDTLLFLCSILFGTVAFFFSIFPFFALPSWTNSFGIWYFLFSFVIINIFPLCVGGGGWTSLESPFLRATFRIEMQIVIDYAAHKTDHFELESWRPFINLIIYNTL